MNISRDIKRAKRFRRLKGLFSASIPYVIRVLSGDWSPFFGTYEGQRYGVWDTFDCWDFSGVEICETQLEQMWKDGKFSPETMDWFKKNNWIDSDGDFYISRRWGAILSGVLDQGNDQLIFWTLIAKYGLIPNWMLPHDLGTGGKIITNRQQFNDDFYNPNIITLEMRAMGQEFLKRIKVQSEEVGRRYYRKDPLLIKTEIRQSPLQLGLPVPQDGYSWNQTKIRWNGRTQADHAVELYKYDAVADPAFPYFIYDSYEPHLKQLSSDYYIPMMTKGVLTPIPTPAIIPERQKSVWEQVWDAVALWLRENPRWSSASSIN